MFEDELKNMLKDKDSGIHTITVNDGLHSFELIVEKDVNGNIASVRKRDLFLGIF